MPREYKSNYTIKSVSAALVTAIILGACAPTVATRGNFLDDDRLKSIQQGVSTKEEVARKLGSPTTVDPFDKNIWFYIGEKTSTKAFFDPVVDERKILQLTFNDEGVLNDAKEIDKQAGKRIAIVEKTTPTPGQDMNMFQQFLSNIGKFNQTAGMGQQPTQGR